MRGVQNQIFPRPLEVVKHVCYSCQMPSYQLMGLFIGFNCPFLLNESLCVQTHTRTHIHKQTALLQ